MVSTLNNAEQGLGFLSSAGAVTLIEFDAPVVSKNIVPAGINDHDVITGHYRKL